MTRRDTILVAVLINAGLLTVLFITALTSSDDDLIDVNTKYVQTPRVAEEAAPPIPQKPAPAPIAAAPIVEKREPVAPPPAPPPVVVKEKKKEEVITHKLPEPVKKVVPKPAPKKQYDEVIVQKGDNLEKIAKAHNTSVAEIIRINDLPNTFLRIGQVLKIPKGTAKKVEKKEAPKKTVAKAEYYTVKVGDNPWTIAMKHHIKVNELLRLNDLDEKKARKLKPGDQLRIR